MSVQRRPATAEELHQTGGAIRQENKHQVYELPGKGQLIVSIRPGGTHHCILSLWTHPAHQNQGVARQLMRALCRDAHRIHPGVITAQDGQRLYAMMVQEARSAGCEIAAPVFAPE